MATHTQLALHQQPLMDTEGRRASKRKVLLTHADIELSPTQVLSGHAVDISLGGAGLISPVNLNVGQEIAIGMSLMACGLSQRISMNGRVAYCMNVGIERFRVGLQWIHLDEDTESFIRAVCN